MSSGKKTPVEVKARLFALWASISKMVEDNARDGQAVADYLQVVIDDKDQYLPLSQKFKVVIDLGLITVPTDYDHLTRLTKFWEKFEGEFTQVLAYERKEVTDQVFFNPSDILAPGQKLRVRIFEQVVSGTTTEERLRFLEEEGAILPGPQGLSLLYEQKGDYLRDNPPEGNNWIVIFCYEDPEHGPTTTFGRRSHSCLMVGNTGNRGPQMKPAVYCPKWEDMEPLTWGKRDFFVVFTPATTEDILQFEVDFEIQQSDGPGPEGPPELPVNLDEGGVIESGDVQRFGGVVDLEEANPALFHGLNSAFVGPEEDLDAGGVIIQREDSQGGVVIEEEGQRFG